MISNDEQSQHSMNVSEQKQVSNYILGKTIGKGTFNKVKIAKHIITNEQVAIKIIQKSKIKNQADQKRLRKQLKILRKVKHPNIIQLYQILEDKNFIYVVTEHAVRGQLFQHIVKSQKMTEFQACKFLQQLLDAIQYIHQIGIAHRDLKPENILLDYKFNIKVIDFGLSNVYYQGQTLKTACGSPCYAAPEMLQGLSYDGLKTDIWSIGIILYAMCFGYLPFDNADSNILYKTIIEGKYEIQDHASQELIDILHIILEVNPQKRATINDIRRHNFCRFAPMGMIPGLIVGLSVIPFEQQIEKMMKQSKIETVNLKNDIIQNKHNHQTATYYLFLQQILRMKNQNLINYYTKKNYLINRYKLIQKVRQNYERRLTEKIEKLKIQRIQRQTQKRSKSHQRSRKRINSHSKYHTSKKDQSGKKSSQKLFGTPEVNKQFKSNTKSHIKVKQKKSKKLRKC